MSEHEKETVAVKGWACPDCQTTVWEIEEELLGPHLCLADDYAGTLKHQHELWWKSQRKNRNNPLAPRGGGTEETQCRAE